MCALVDDVTGREGAPFVVGEPLVLRGAGARRVLEHAGLPFRGVEELAMTPTSEAGEDGTRRWTLRARYESPDVMRDQLALTSRQLGLDEGALPVRALHRKTTLMEATMTLGLIERGHFRLPGSLQEFEITAARATVDD